MTMKNADRPQIERCVSTYIDTICLFVRRQLPASLLAAITRENPGRVYRDKKRRWDGQQWVVVGWMITIHQPTRRTFELLSNYRPSSFHLAFDFHHTNPTKLLVQKWHTGEQIECENSTYWGLKGKRRNIDSYASKPSKITGRDCSHIEFRFSTPAACKAAAFKRRDDPPLTFGDLLQLDPVKLLTHQTKLCRVDLKRLDQIMEGKARCRWRPGGRYTVPEIKEYLTYLILRTLHVDDLSEASSQQIYDLKRGFKECLVEVGWDQIVGNSSMISKTPEKVAHTAYTMWPAP